MSVAKIITLIGSSKESWEDAARQCLQEASRTIKGVVGIDIVKQTAKVKDGEICEYKVTCNVAFKVER